MSIPVEAPLFPCNVETTAVGVTLQHSGGGEHGHTGYQTARGGACKGGNFWCDAEPLLPHRFSASP